MTDPIAPSKAPAVITGKVTVLGKDASKKAQFESALLTGPGAAMGYDDKNGRVLHSNALEYEDAFAGQYGIGGFIGNTGVVIIEPPFNPLTLEKLAKHNNALGPCINAMVTNIDGTGFEIINTDLPESTDETSPNDKQKESIEEFFAEPWPGVSFTTMRKDLRKDLETLGYGFLEVIRNPKGQIIFLRHVEAKTVRLVRLDDGIPVTRKVTRGGVEQSTTVSMRFRRFVQVINMNFIFFKEFQADTELDKKTGKWADLGVVLPLEKRASELIYFVAEKDINTPYGVPRWIAQLPSVLGSRKAEENNLEFFDSGGIAPFIMIVEGGILAQETKDALQLALSSDVTTKRRGLVVEAHNSSGSLNDAGNNVSVKTEKFGAENQTDSQYEVYDEKCENRIRGSFRLPAIFSGRSDATNYSTAFVSYMLAEAQVFAPERQAFDEVISLKLIPDILKDSARKIQMRSLPIVVNDAKEKVMAIQLAMSAQAVTKGEVLSNLNEVTGMDMNIAPGEADMLCPAPSKPAGGPTGNVTGLNTDSQMTDASTVPPTGGDTKPAPAKTTGGDKKVKPKGKH